MKIQVKDSDNIILYLYNYFFKTEEKDIIVREIKKIFIRLIKNYHFKIGGIYDVLVYENKDYGTILEIEKKEELLFNPDLIDIKVRIIKDRDFYYKTSDYFIIEAYDNIYYKDSYYYIKIDNRLDLTSLSEFGNIEYNIDNKLKSMIKIK